MMVKTQVLLENSAAFFSKLWFKLIPGWFILCTIEKTEVSSANNLGVKLKLSGKLLINIRIWSGSEIELFGTLAELFWWLRVLLIEENCCCCFFMVVFFHLENQLTHLISHFAIN